MIYNSRVSRIFIAALLLLFIASITNAAEERPEEAIFTGIWKGIISNSDQEVDLTVAASEEDNSAISFSLHFNPPRSCKLNAVKSSMEEHKIQLVFDEASGGFCDKLWKGNLTLELLDFKNLKAEIQKSSIGFAEEAFLSKPAQDRCSHCHSPDDE